MGRKLFLISLVCVIIPATLLHDSYAKEHEKTVFSPRKLPRDKHAALRNEIFKCNQVDEDVDVQSHAILKKSDFDRIQYFALKGIPLLNPFSPADRDFFIKAIASTIGKVNEIILEQRKFILSIRKKQQKYLELTPLEADQYKKICDFYQTKDFFELLRRVAPVPISLAVAQAILESRFGSNRNIHSLNAYFGLAKSKTRLLKFDSLFNSAIAYVKTLSVNKRYREFRKQREIMTGKFGKVEGIKLVPYIKNYGTDKNYSKLIGRLIKRYRLHIFYD